MLSKPLLLTALAFLSTPAFANICGTDYQNFNPTTNGLDFVTVQSSETLKPCIINMGLFFNYASNSLTYSRTLNAGFQNGQKGHDKTLGADLSLGMGLTDRWDVGLNVPMILSQTVEDDYYVASYGNTGVTEIKANTKYHLLGDDSGGLAAILSVNKNLISDDPFAGKNAGPTWNFELAADTTLAEKWAVGVNVGYRLRDKGDPVPNTPFVPMGNQWIYSTAASYLIASLDTKVIAEIYGSRPAERIDQDTDRSMNSLEGLLGLKYDATSSLAVHVGGTTQLDNSLGGPDWRAYVGLNWAFGAGCEKKTEAPVVSQVTSQEVSTPEKPTSVEAIKLDVELLFKWNSEAIDEKRFESLDPFFQETFKRPFDRMVVEGHTDSVGVEVYNMDLSQRRAKNVRDLLVTKYKLPSEKVEAIGYGQTQPIADNGNFQGRRKNRRVEIKIYRH
jgi:outer membrane protein OmpA-like peptidoglycan-associated protein